METLKMLEKWIAGMEFGHGITDAEFGNFEQAENKEGLTLGSAKLLCELLPAMSPQQIAEASSMLSLFFLKLRN